MTGIATFSLIKPNDWTIYDGVKETSNKYVTIIDM